jgi:RNA polymerase sigma-70 factor (ECF subfamily)
VTFDEVYERFRRPVWRLARRMTGSEEEARDATQEVFLRVWRGLPGFRGEAKLSTWVFQIAWNYLRLHQRRAGRRPPLVVVSDEEAAAVVERAPDPGPDPERHATAADLLDRVEAAIDRLPEQFRVILWLRDGEGRSYEEVAEVLDIPLGTVRSRLARARQALKRELEG